MHDEATTHFVDMLDQTTTGHTFLHRTFGYKPRVGWQLDPFGHSSIQQSLFSAECGFSSLFIGRIDYQDIQKRRDSGERSCEWIWDTSKSYGPESAVFSGLTGSFSGNYGPPKGFDFETGHVGPAVVDDARLSTYNVPERVATAIARAKKQQSQTRGKHQMWTMGSDFNYESALSWFTNLDRLIHHVNQDGTISMVYSSPEEYTKAKASEWKDGFKTAPGRYKTDDFFPYANNGNSMWTGYFTSRPALKRYVRETSGWYQAIKRMDALAFSHDDQTLGLGHWAWEDQAPRALMNDALGVAQHHDAVSGTEKQAVAHDYARRIHLAVTNTQPAVARILTKLINLPNGTRVSQCLLANVSVCEATSSLEKSGYGLPFVVFNSMGHRGVQMVDIPIYSQNVALLDNDGKEIQTIISPALPARSQYGSDIIKDAAGYTLHFRALTPPLGFAKFMLQNKRCTKCRIAESEVVYTPEHKKHMPKNNFEEANHDEEKSSWARIGHSLRSLVLRDSTDDNADDDSKLDYDANDNMKHGDNEIEIGNEHLIVTFKDGMIFKMKNLLRKVTINITQQLLQYVSCAKDKCGAGPADGAYCFRPLDNAVHPVFSDAPTLEKCGDLEVRQSFGNNTAIQRFRVIDAHLEITWTVGPIDRGAEVISRFQTSIDSQNQCWTDSNGLDMQYRKKDHRPSWNYSQPQPVAGNYFPINSGMFIRDATTQLTLVVDRAQGGTGVLENGQMEVMLHRSSFSDDDKGVEESKSVRNLQT
jgi:alpha-mannosidase